MGGGIKILFRWEVDKKKDKKKVLDFILKKSYNKSHADIVHR